MPFPIGSWEVTVIAVILVIAISAAIILFRLLSKRQSKRGISSNKRADYLHHDGIAFGRLGKHKKAIACFDKAIQINPRDNTAWHRKGIELNASAKYNGAIDCFDKAIQINLKDHFAWNHRAVALRELGKYEEALYCCNEAIKINDKYSFGWYNKGVILSHLENYEEATASYDRANQLNPKSFDREVIAEAKQAVLTNKLRGKLNQWEAEGYNVSELRKKWFPARRSASSHNRMGEEHN